LLNHPEQPEVIDGVEAYKIHPLVGRQLTHMSTDLRDLEATKSVADADQQKLADVRGEATTYMNQGVAVKRDMARTEAAIHRTQKTLAKFKGEDGRIEHEHDKLMTTLKGIMEPKINAAEGRVSKRTQDASDVQQKLSVWEERQKKYKAAAMMKLRERRSTAEGLNLADESFAKAQQEQQVAEESYDKARKEASQQVEAYRYVETRFQAVETQLKEKSEEERQDDKSLNKMRGVLQLESEKVNQASTFKQARLKQQIQDTEKQIEQAQSQHKVLRGRYDEWRVAERERADVVAQRKQAYTAALDSYKEKHADVLDKAESNAARTATHDANWGQGGGDWAWSDDDGNDPQGEEVHLSD